METKNLDFGTRVLQKFHTSFIVVVPKPLIDVLKLREGIGFNFVLNDEGTITLRLEETEQIARRNGLSQEEPKKALTGGDEKS